MLLIFGGLGHDHDDGHDNLTGVDSTPVNCGEDKYFIHGQVCLIKQLYNICLSANGLRLNRLLFILVLTYMYMYTNIHCCYMHI